MSTEWQSWDKNTLTLRSWWKTEKTEGACYKSSTWHLENQNRCRDLLLRAYGITRLDSRATGCNTSVKRTWRYLLSEITNSPWASSHRKPEGLMMTSLGVRLRGEPAQSWITLVWGAGIKYLASSTWHLIWKRRCPVTRYHDRLFVIRPSAEITMKISVRNEIMNSPWVCITHVGMQQGLG